MDFSNPLGSRVEELNETTKARRWPWPSSAPGCLL